MNIVKKYYFSPYKWLFLTNIFETIGMNMFNLVFLMYVNANADPSIKGWLLTLVSVMNSIPALLNALTGYWADISKHKLRIARWMKIGQFGLFMLISIVIMHDFSPYFCAFILIFNLVSDLIGQYSVGLLYPTMISLVSNDDREHVIGYQTGVLRTITLVSQFLGISLLTALNNNYFIFSLLNSFIFLLSTLFLSKLKSKLTEETPSSHAKDTKQPFMKSFQLIFSVPLLGRYLSIYLVAGIIATSLEQVLILYLTQNPLSQIGNFGYSVALFGVVFSVGQIIGSLIRPNFLMKVHFTTLLIYQVFSIALIIIVLLVFSNFLYALAMLLITAYLQGVNGPKFSAWIMNQNLGDNIAMSLGIINTVGSIAFPIGTLVFMSIANIFSVSISFYVMLIYVVLLVFYILNVKRYESAHSRL
ncbi:MAG: MFS transporter [Lactobacillaceae bacterium]|jgi:MFS family permease|nr:MFS transporter [Lactobacillaceae bacterium]